MINTTPRIINGRQYFRKGLLSVDNFTSPYKADVLYCRPGNLLTGPENSWFNKYLSLSKINVLTFFFLLKVALFRRLLTPLKYIYQPEQITVWAALNSGARRQWYMWAYYCKIRNVTIRFVFESYITKFANLHIIFNDAVFQFIVFAEAGIRRNH